MFLAVLFPYFHPFTFIVRSDTQVWSGIIAGITVLVIQVQSRKLYLPVPLVILSFIAVFSLLYLFVNGDFEFGIRSVFGYGSVPLIAYVAFRTYRHVWAHALPTAVGLWFLVGVIQSVWDRDFGRNLLPRLDTDSLRGITGLTPEPSFLGVMGLMMLVLNEFAYSHSGYRNHVYYSVMLALVLLILASSSGVGLVLLVGYLTVRTLLALHMHDRAAHALADVAAVTLVTWILFVGLDNSNPLSKPLNPSADPTPTAFPSPKPTSTPAHSATQNPVATSAPLDSPTAPAAGSPVLSETNTPVVPEVTASAPPSPLDTTSPEETVTALPSQPPTLQPKPTERPLTTPVSTSSPEPTAVTAPTPTATLVPSATPTPSVPRNLAGSRGRNILQRLFDDPLQVFERDASVGERTAHVLLSGMSLWNSKGVGYGPGTWNDHALELRDSAPDWIQRMTVRKFDLGGRVMSGWGTAMFELGIVGLLFIATALIIMGKSVAASPRLAPVALLSAILVSATMIGAVPLALPAFGYIIGIHLWVAYGRHEDETPESEHETDSAG